MLSRVLCTLFFVSAGLRLDAADLYGRVLSNAPSGLGLPNVKVEPVAGANATVTLDEGTFHLVFPGKQAGEVVHLILRKPGHVVIKPFFENTLRQILPKVPDAEMLELVMCKEADREEMLRNLIGLIAVKEIDTKFQQRLQELEARSQTNATDLAALRTERDQAKAAAEKAAEDLARLKPEQTSELHQQAMRLFLDGKVTDAIKLLDQDQLRRAVAAARKQRADAEQELAEAIEAYLLKARLLATQLRFEEAAKTYEDASAADPESYAASFAHAAFFQELGRPEKALPIYERALAIARRHKSQPDVATTLNNLGVLHRKQERMEDARLAFDEALKSFRQLARDNPQKYRPDVAMTLNNLGDLNRVLAQKRMDDASEAFEESLKTYRELADKNPEAYRPSVATALNNLGNLYRDQHQMDDALQAYDEALKIYSALADKNPETYRPDVAMTLNNLGIVHFELGRMEFARQKFGEALKIYGEFAVKNPEQYQPDVALTQINLGILERSQDRIEDARLAYDQALKIYERFAQKNPDQFQQHVERVKSLLDALGK